jgi:hypothetical protein
MGTTKLLVPANGCGKLEAPPHCTGPQIANLSIDLAGVITLTFGAPFGSGNVLLLDASFASVPEPSSALVVLFSAAAIIVMAWRRKLN